jgi:hypothetical protein
LQMAQREFAGSIPDCRCRRLGWRVGGEAYSLAATLLKVVLRLVPAVPMIKRPTSARPEAPNAGQKPQVCTRFQISYPSSLLETSSSCQSASGDDQPSPNNWANATELSR